jgi:2-polyprenyl-3-methyl-5-hydroxy-6-metoxy-1,4-benzoquinol methylase
VATSAANERRDALVVRLFNAQVETLELFSVYLGVRLGLYRTLAEAPDGLTETELAERAGIARRYACEWLEQQAVAGIIDVDDAGAQPDERRYRLDSAHADVLAHEESQAHVAPFALLSAGIGQALPKVVEAYRSGSGVPYSDYGADFRDGQGGINRPAFTHEIGDWIGAMPDVHLRLGGEPPARVAEIGSGQGWAAIGLAKAYPHLRVDGFDLDVASVEDATRNAAAAGLADRVRFEQLDAAQVSDRGPYELVLLLETLHDLAQPVEALAAARAALSEGGSVLVADERVADRFQAPGDEIERMMYGWSVLHCLPTQLVEEPTAATGTVLRVDMLRRLAADAGFSRVDVLPIENDFFRFYRLSG